MGEKEFYSKLCVAAGLSFVVDESLSFYGDKNESRVEDFNLTANDKFSRNIATILTRDKEVVAVKLIVLAEKCIILISKNGKWYGEIILYEKDCLKNVAEYPFQGIHEIY